MKKTVAFFLALSVAFLCGCNTNKNAALYSEHYKIDSAMFSYYFNSEYIKFVTANKENLSDYSLDTSTDLSEQTCPLTNDTWHTYFADSAEDRLERYLILREQARTDKKDLSEEGEQKVTSALEIMRETAKEKGKTLDEYLKASFGENVTEKTVKKCLELEFLAEDYYTEYSENLKADKSVYENYYNSNIKTFAKADYLYMVIEADSNGSLTDDGYKTALKLENAENKTEFLNICEDYFYDYFLQKYGENAKDKAKASAAKQMENVENIGAVYDGSSAAAWAFSNGLKAGDTKLVKDNENSYYYIYYLVTPPYREDYNLVTMRQIMFGSDDKAKENAENCLKQLEEKNFNSETFSALCEEYTTDTETKQSGGIYENIRKGNLADADEIEEWLFSDARKAGDYTLLKTEKYGWHIIYLESFGDAVWLTDVKDAYNSGKFNLYIETLGDNILIRKNTEIINSVKETEQ